MLIGAALFSAVVGSAAGNCWKVGAWIGSGLSNVVCRTGGGVMVGGGDVQTFVVTVDPSGPAVVYWPG